MFAYCNNNPINMEDPSGNFPLALPFLIPIVKAVIVTAKAVIVIAATYVVVNTAVSVYKTNKTRTRYNTKSVSISAANTHGNSKKSKKPQHGYEIYNKRSGDVVKCGISGGKIRLDGKSYRLEKQVRDFNELEKGHIYASRIMGYFPDRQSALDWEWLNSQYRYYQKHSMKYHKLPAFDNWYRDID